MVDEGMEVVDLYVKAVNAFFSRDVNFSVEIIKQIKRIEKLDQEIANTTFMNRQKTRVNLRSLVNTRRYKKNC